MIPPEGVDTSLSLSSAPRAKDTVTTPYGTRWARVRGPHNRVKVSGARKSIPGEGHASCDSGWKVSGARKSIPGKGHAS